MSNFCIPHLAFRPVGRKPATSFLSNPQPHHPRLPAKPAWLSVDMGSPTQAQLSREDVSRCLQIWFDYYYPASAMGFRDPRLGNLFLQQRQKSYES